ncbi:hypothetical protein CCMSSC00406_0007906 [Pleurotus cornucopiae]|uniref:Uncharacterized protein n=1 Tax=Pleurotus cornucopiae TaxID=5321 RepID=A0ACB7IQ96_PLECO|nr:hypothetical protein CCMSSC00406_0007906 [Pleurotus cornucopiae]
MAPRVWLITGASSGFGRAMTDLVLREGETVVATARSPHTLDDLITTHSANQLLVLKCDVTIPEDILSAFRGAYDKFGRCDVVFNNAGCALVAEWENADQDELAKNVFDVNFWGAARVSREAVRVFRDLNPAGEGGLLLTSGSLTGQLDSPGAAIYSASKHALDGLTAALAKEIDPKWNIKICIIEPSMFKTRIFEKGGLPVFPPHPAYENPDLPTQKLRRGVAALAGPFGDPRKGVERIYQLSKLERSEIPLRLPFGKPAVPGILKHYENVTQEIQKFESLSEGLETDA